MLSSKSNDAVSRNKYQIYLLLIVKNTQREHLLFNLIEQSLTEILIRIYDLKLNKLKKIMTIIQYLFIYILLIATSVPLNLRSIHHQQTLVWNHTSTTQNQSEDQAAQNVSQQTNTSETPEGTLVWEGSLDNNDVQEQEKEKEEDCDCDPKILVQPKENDPNIVITQPIEFNPFAQPQGSSQSSQLDNNQSGDIAEVSQEGTDQKNQPSTSQQPQFTQPTSIKSSTIASQPLLMQPVSTIPTTTASQPQQSSPIQSSPLQTAPPLLQISTNPSEPNQTPIISGPQDIQPQQSKPITNSQLSTSPTIANSQPLAEEPIISHPILVTDVSNKQSTTDDLLLMYPQPISVEPIIVSETPSPSKDIQFDSQQTPITEQSNLEYLSPIVVKPVVVS